MSSDAAARRARRLIRWYPAAWRARYGDEFLQLLLDDIDERPRSRTRTLDVVRSGLEARLAASGLTAAPCEPHLLIRARLGVVSFAFTAFLLAGLAIWAQLTIGWQWSQPAAPGTRTGMLVMSAAMLGLVLLAAAAALPLIWAACRDCARGRARELGPALVAVSLGGLVLILGSVHFGHGWPGTGGHPWAGRDLVPGYVARISWAATLWITSYWAHPGALASFPAAELGWMVLSPAALATALLGIRKTLRRITLSPLVLRYESWLGLAAALAMAAFLAGAASWIVSGGPAPRGLFRVGVIDAAGIFVMATSLIVAFGAARRALAVHPAGPATG